MGKITGKIVKIDTVQVNYVSQMGQVILVIACCLLFYKLT